MVWKNYWGSPLLEAFQQEGMIELKQFLEEEYRQKTVYPPADEIFMAFKLTSYEEVKVVILGQDPYHGPNQANGLSFSVNPGEKIPPSLRNIYKELAADLGCSPPENGDLGFWARQGVLLLNTTLTVAAGHPMSHTKKGWETFTDRVLASLDKKESPIVFLLWGNHARSKSVLVDGSRHLILESAHPSPLSARRGFFGSRPFSRANEFLEAEGLEPIKWCP